MPRSADVCRLICIDPAQAREFWPYVAPLIEAAMRKGRLTNYVDVERDVLAGGALVWIAWNGENIKAAAVTEIASANGERFCTIVACGAQTSLRSLRKLDCDDRRQWLPLIAGLESYARAEGCAAMRIYGRRGWLRLLPDYRASRVLLEKEL
jgi:hypothetical protein